MTPDMGRCMTCGGDGEVVELRTYRASVWEPPLTEGVEVECPECAGTGREPCEECGQPSTLCMSLPPLCAACEAGVCG
jgi:DnaJ-class molecular chaperone